MKEQDPSRLFFSGNEMLAHSKREKLIYTMIVGQPVYFLTTLDEFGNDNTMVVTQFMPSADFDPYRIAFAIRRLNITDNLRRQTYDNLRKHPEFVLSLGENKLADAVSICGDPYIPYGISEMEVAGFTRLPSRNVAPPGIQECKVNIECKVDRIEDLTMLSIVVGTVVGLNLHQSVWNRIDDRLAQMELIDPLLEVDVVGNPPRHWLVTLNKERPIKRKLVGCKGSLHGRFDQWMKDLKQDGHITDEEEEMILNIWKRWENFRDPKKNVQMKQLLSSICKHIVNEDWDSLRTELNVAPSSSFHLKY